MNVTLTSSSLIFIIGRECRLPDSIVELTSLDVEEVVK
jgi:hypothetical protein